MLDVPSRPTLFLDESGDPNPRSVSADYPVFVLGGVICDSEYADTVVREALNSIKQDLFGATNFTLHTADFKRYRGPFRILKNDIARRVEFHERILQLLQNLDYTVLACVIHRPPAVSRVNRPQLDLYQHALQILLSPFCDEIGQASAGRVGQIIVEARPPSENRALEREWEALQYRGTFNLRGSVIQRRIRSFQTRTKSDLVPGLELADLIVSPIGRHAIGKSPVPEWSSIEPKLRRSASGEVDGYGILTVSAISA